MTPQAPIPSGFGPASTADEVIAGVDLTGKVAIVTGGYAGIGLETARVLATAGARVIVPARDMDKARKALPAVPGARLEHLDLMDPASIDAFAARVLADEPEVHILINNAAVMANPLTRDGRGYESQFSTNHLGHFQLAARLWPALRAANGARVVAISSRGHHIAPVDFEDPNFERRDYDPWLAYGQSKTADALFALKLDALGQAHGVRAFSVHPGAILTNLAQYMTPEQLRAQGAIDEQGRPILDPVHNMKTIAQGAATSVWCATSPQLDGMGGVYCEDCDIAVVAPETATDRRGVKPWAMNPDFADRLWTLSEGLTNAGLAN